MPNPYKQDQVKTLCDLFWKFHNDRLNDPTINDMTPYVKPILELINGGSESQVREIADAYNEVSRKVGELNDTCDTLEDLLSNALKSKGEDRELV